VEHVAWVTVVGNMYVLKF